MRYAPAVTHSDDELLALARTGDARATTELLTRHEKSIYRFGLRMCGNEEDAREVLQDTLLAAFRHLPGFRGEAALSTWLYQLARSFCLKSRRLKSGEPATFVDVDSAAAVNVPSEDHGPDARAHAREIAQALGRALRELPATSREAVILRDVEGLSVEEAAKVAGLEVPAFKSRLHRARLVLRKKLAMLGDDEVTLCQQLARELVEDNLLDIDQSACERIERHFASCPKCGDAMDHLRQTVSLCRALPHGDAVPPHVQEAVRRALLAIAAP